MIDLNDNKRLYFSVKEVAQHFHVNESLLRFWEKEFDTIKPRKTATGTRQYTKEDINAITLVYHLVKEKGMTLDGARQHLKQKKDEETRKLETIEKLEKIKEELLRLSESFDLQQ